MGIPRLAGFEDIKCVTKQYLIYLIKKKTPKPSEKIMQLIETDDLTNIELAYLLTYPNEES